MEPARRALLARLARLDPPAQQEQPVEQVQLAPLVKQELSAGPAQLALLGERVQQVEQVLQAPLAPLARREPLAEQAPQVL